MMNRSRPRIEPERPPRWRLFFALWPDRITRARFAAIDLGRTPASIRRVPPANLHATLVFLGSTPATDVPRLKTIAAQIRAPAFELEFGHLDSFRRAGVVFSGVASAPPALMHLVRCLRSGIGDNDAQAFRCHVTLARGISRRLERASHPPVKWAVDEFCLMRSESAQRGVRYATVARWPLAGATGHGGSGRHIP